MGFHRHGGADEARRPQQANRTGCSDGRNRGGGAGNLKKIAIALATPMLAAGFRTPAPAKAPTTPAGPSAPMTPGLRVPQTPVPLDESSRKRKAEEDPQSTGRKSDAATAQETEGRKRKVDDDNAAQSKQEDRELTREGHGVKRSAEELETNMNPKSKRMYPPTYAGNVRRVRKNILETSQKC